MFQVIRQAPTSLLLVKDIAIDPRFDDDPANFGGSGIRFYAGVPIVGDKGHLLGLLFVGDVAPRSLNAEETDGLTRLAGLVNGLVGLPKDSSTFNLIQSLDASIKKPLAVTNPNLPDQPFTYCNRAFCELTGYRLADLLGRNCRILQGLGTDPLAVAQLQAGLTHGWAPTTTVKNYRKDGTEFWNELSIVVDRGIEGEIRQFVWIAKDVTARFNDQRRSDLTSNLFENMPDQVYVVDSETHRFMLANQLATQTIGYSEEELLTLTPADLSPDNGLADWCEVTRPIREDVVDALVLRARLRRRDGTIYPVDVRMQRAIVANRNAILLIAKDRTDRQNVERFIEDGSAIETELRMSRLANVSRKRRLLSEALTQAQAMNREKSKFLAAASHDLRQPLQSIGLSLSLFQETVASRASDEYMQSIQLSVDAMGKLLDGLLDISRFDNAEVSVNRSSFHLQELLNRVCANSARQATRKGLQLACAKTDLILYSDPALLERIIENLASNAVRYTETGSVSITMAARGTAVRIKIEDTGIGIPGSALTKIFDEYIQLDNGYSNRAKGLGLGLGLAIVKRLSVLLGHPVQVRSQLGKGSAFYLDVPKGVLPMQTDPEKSVSLTRSSSDRSGEILYVEDDNQIASLTTQLLTRNGLSVRSADGLTQALQHIASGYRPDVLLTDYRLAGESGLEVIHKVRAACATPIPALILTGDPNVPELSKQMPVRCELLLKPIRVELLLSAIDDALVQDT